MAIELKHVSKSFGGVHALSDVSLTFGGGKIYGLLGSNGAGKTTMLNIITNRLYADSGEVLVNWDRIKERTKGQKTATETLRSVSAALPALMRSEKVQHRAAKVGFDYPDTGGALRDLESEVAELREAISEGDAAHIDEELGDVLFAAVNVSRFTHVDAEQSLGQACEKFIDRFEQVEALARERGVDMKTAGIEKLDELWKQAKKRNAAKPND